MRLLIILSAVFFALAFVCIQVPTALIGIGFGGWLALGLLSFILDALFGGGLTLPPMTLRRQ